MKKVLIPTDFSENARNAMEYAIQLSGINGYEFVLLNAFKTPNAGSGGMLVSLDEVLEKEGVKDLKREKIYFEEKYPGINISIRCKHGELDNVIRKTNIEEEIDYVIMGTQGSSGVQKVLVGSNTQRVIENVVRPVVAIPEGYEYRSLKKIVFASDLKRVQNGSTFDPIVELATIFNAQVLILHAINDPTEDFNYEEEKNRLELDKVFKDIDHSYHVEVNSSTVDGINNFIDEHNAEVLALMPRTVSFLEGLFKSSVTRSFAFQAKIPLLAIKEKS